MKKYLAASKSKNRTNRQTQAHASRRPLLSSSSCQMIFMSQIVDPLVQNLPFDIVSCKRGSTLMVFCQVLVSTQNYGLSHMYCFPFCIDISSCTCLLFKYHVYEEAFLPFTFTVLRFHSSAIIVKRIIFHDKYTFRKNLPDILI